MSDPLQIVLTKPIAALVPHGIGFNFDELRAGVTAIAQKYEGLLVTEDQLEECAKDRARLNKFISSLEEFRKAVKREWNEPYAAFEAKMKELVAIVTAPRDAIDEQLKRFEEKRKGDRMDEIGAFYDAHVGELADLVSLDSIMQTKWLNKTCADSAWQSELLAALSEIRRNIESARAIAPEGLEDETVERYLQTRSLGDTIAWATDRKAQLAKLRALAEAHEAPKPLSTPAAPVAAAAPAVKPKTDPVMTFTLRFTGPRSKLVALRQFMAENGISYEKVDFANEEAASARKKEARRAS